MSETPTTEQIRKGLLTGYVSDSEFDRWLAGVKKEERERIVKIVQSQTEWNDHFWWHGVVDLNHNCYDCEDVRTLIDLIRKEDNDS